MLLDFGIDSLVLRREGKEGHEFATCLIGNEGGALGVCWGSSLFKQRHRAKSKALSKLAADLRHINSMLAKSLTSGSAAGACKPINLLPIGLLGLRKIS